MIGDETRRKVARRLRVLAETPDEIGITEHAVVSTLGISAGIYDDSCRSEDVLIVADLIDRPTCHDATNNFYEFVCSKCGCSLDISNDFEPTLWVDGKATVPSYCPNCGAEVVDED